MKLWNYIVLMLSLMIFLEFVGLQTGLSTTLSNFGVEFNDNSELISGDLENSGFFSQIFGSTGILIVLISTGVGAVVVGLFAKSYDTSLVVLPLVIWVGTLFASTFWSIIQYVPEEQKWMTALIATIFIPLGAGFLWSCVEFFRGVD